MRVPSLKLRFSFARTNHSSTPSYSRSLAITAAVNLVMAGLGVISGLWVARLLGPTGRGEFAAIQTWPNFLAVLSAFGLYDALAYYVAREPHNTGKWFGTATLLALLVSIPFAVIGYWLMPWLLSAQSSAIIEAAQKYLLWFIPINILVGFPAYPLRARNDLVAWNLLRILPALVWIGVLLYNTMIEPIEPGSLSRHYLFAFTALVIPVWYMAYQRLPSSLSFSRKHVAPLFKYGLPSALSFIPSSLNLRLDQMLIAGLLGPRILGLYVVAVAWSNAFSPFINALSATLLPRMASATSHTQSIQLFAQVSRIGVLLSIIMSTITAISAPFAIPVLFGKGYDDSIAVAILLAAASGIATFNQLLVAGAMSLGEPRFALLSEGIGFVVTSVFLLILLQPYQLMGAAIASICSYVVVALVLITLVQKKTALRIDFFLLPRMADLNTIAARLGAMLGQGSLPKNISV